jgi:hypothetical protein
VAAIEASGTSSLRSLHLNFDRNDVECEGKKDELLHKFDACCAKLGTAFLKCDQWHEATISMYDSTNKACPLDLDWPFSQLIRCMPQLKKLDLTIDWNSDYDSIPHHLLESIEKLPDLQEVELCCVHYATTRRILQVLLCAEHLVSLFYRPDRPTAFELFPSHNVSKEEANDLSR